MMDLERPPGEDGIVTSGRPIYERPANLKDERDAIPKIERLWGCSLVKLPIAYNLDFAAVRDGRVVAWIEFKRRHRLFGAFADVFLSVQKLRTAHQLESVSKAGSFFVVQFDDVLVSAPILGEWPIEIRGRTDRGDWQDLEPVARIPTSAFRILQTN
jgi:hypothetical protein